MGISNLYHNIRDPEVWLETTQSWQGDLDRAAKYWCLGAPGLVQSVMGLAQIVAGVAIVIFPSEALWERPANTRSAGWDLARRGCINLIDGVREVIPVVGTIVAVERITAVHTISDYKQLAKQFWQELAREPAREILESKQMEQEDLQAHRLREIENRPLTDEELYVVNAHDLQKRFILNWRSEENLSPEIFKIIKNEHSSEEIFRREGVECLRKETEVLSVFIDEQQLLPVESPPEENRKPLNAVRAFISKKCFVNKEDLSVGSFGEKKNRYLFRHKMGNIWLRHKKNNGKTPL